MANCAKCLLFVILLTFLQTNAVNGSLGKRASFGKFCDSETKVYCKSREFLTCQDNRCTCVKPDAMTYDQSRNSCVTLVGERCSYTVVSTVDSEENIKGFKENMHCIAHSSCLSDIGICKCDTHYFEASDGSCNAEKGQGEKCKEDKQCRGSWNLKCAKNDEDQGICECDPTNSKFSQTLKTCVGTAGNNCFNGNCVKNAACDSRQNLRQRYANSYREYDVRNPDYNMCSCQSGYTKTSDGLCLIPHGENCENTDELCLNGLKCLHERCRCPYEKSVKYQSYNALLEKCITDVGGPCSMELYGSSQCVDHASCNSQKHDAPQCTCDPGYVENSDGKCDLAYGESCPIEGTQCDRLAKLSCINKKCQCETDLEAYNLTSMKCVGLVGSPCEYSVSNKQSTCIEGSVCTLRRNQNPENGICKCKEGFTYFTNNRTCLLLDAPAEAIITTTAEPITTARTIP